MKTKLILAALIVFVATVSFGKPIKSRGGTNITIPPCYKIPLPSKPEWRPYNISDDLTTGEVWLKPDDADTLATNLENIRIYAEQLETAVQIHNDQMEVNSNSR